VEDGSLAVDTFKGRVTQSKPFDIILVFIYLFFRSLFVLLPTIYSRSDGCFNAVHGRYGGDGSYPVLFQCPFHSATRVYRMWRRLLGDGIVSSRFMVGCISMKGVS
jgi:hypothetical protein